MIYRRRHSRSFVPGGFHHFENINKTKVYGFGEGEYIQLRDEFGNVWRGTAQRDEDNAIRYRFRDNKGNSITGISDHYGVVLRDEKGNTWRGFVS